MPPITEKKIGITHGSWVFHLEKVNGIMAINKTESMLPSLGINELHYTTYTSYTAFITIFAYTDSTLSYMTYNIED